MIDLMENKLLAPLIQRQYQKGRDEGMQGLLVEVLTEKFGALPAWADTRLQSASNDELHTWANRVLHSDSLKDTLR